MDCHWLHGGIESLQSIRLAREAVNSSFIILFSSPTAKVMAGIKGEGERELFIVQAPQDCEVPRQDWS